MNCEAGGKISWTAGLRGRRSSQGLLRAACCSDRNPVMFDKDKGRVLQLGGRRNPKSLVRLGAIWQKGSFAEKKVDKLNASQ